MSFQERLIKLYTDAANPANLSGGSRRRRRRRSSKGRRRRSRSRRRGGSAGSWLRDQAHKLHAHVKEKKYLSRAAFHLLNNAGHTKSAKAASSALRAFGYGRGGTAVGDWRHWGRRDRGVNWPMFVYGYVL